MEQLLQFVPLPLPPFEHFVQGKGGIISDLGNYDKKATIYIDKDFTEKLTDGLAVPFVSPWIKSIHILCMDTELADSEQPDWSLGVSGFFCNAPPGSFGGVKELELGPCGFVPYPASRLAEVMRRLTCLEELDMTKIQLSPDDDGLSVLAASLPRLRRLVLPTGSPLLAYLTIPQLQTLVLDGAAQQGSYNRVGEAVRRLAGLQRLEISDVNFSSSSMKELLYGGELPSQLWTISVQDSRCIRKRIDITFDQQRLSKIDIAPGTMWSDKSLSLTQLAEITGVAIGEPDADLSSGLKVHVSTRELVVTQSEINEWESAPDCFMSTLKRCSLEVEHIDIDGTMGYDSVRSLLALFGRSVRRLTVKLFNQQFVFSGIGDNSEEGGISSSTTGLHVNRLHSTGFVSFAEKGVSSRQAAASAMVKITNGVWGGKGKWASWSKEERLKWLLDSYKSAERRMVWKPKVAK